MTDFEQYGLKEIPFHLIPERITKHWAGRERLKEELLDLIDSPRSSDTGLSEFVVLHGSYGAGKSHALRYLCNHIDENRERYNSKAVYVESIRIADNIKFLPLYKQIAHLLGDEYIFNVSRKVNGHVRKLIAEEKHRLPNGVVDVITEKRLLDAVLQEKFEQELRDMIRLLCKISSRENEEGASDLLRDNAQSDFGAAKSLGAFFRCLGVCKNDDDKPIADANYLFLDEVEATTEVKVPESQAFFNAMLQLVNQLPENFCIIFSFSGDTALMEAIVNEALLQRMTREPIELPALEHDEAKDFLANHFASYRVEGFDNPNAFHPFAEEAIGYIIDRASPPMTPRSLFRDLRKVLERSIKRDRLAPGEEIQKEDAERILGGFN